MRNRTMVVWILILAIAISVHAVTAAMPTIWLHALISAMVSLVIAVLAVRENETPITSDAGVYALSASNAHYMGVVWSWAAVTVALTYGLVLQWPEWWHFVLPFGAAAILCLCFANLMTKGAENTTPERALKISRFLAIVQMVGALAVMAGLILGGKLPFLSGTPSAQAAREWAANDVIFFGATALSAIGFAALRSYNRALGAGLGEPAAAVSK